MNPDFRKYYNAEIFLILFPILLFFIIRFIIGFNGLYGQDSHEYYRYSRAIVNFFKTGDSPGDYFWPVYYPILGAIAGLVIDNLFSLQLISVLSLSGSLYFLYKIIDTTFEEKKYVAVYLLIFFTLSPNVFRFSIVVMSDMLSVFCITSSFYFFINYLNGGNSKQVFLFSIFAALAVLTRYAAFVVLFIPALMILIEIIKKRKYSHLIIAIIIALIVIIPHILIRKTNSTEFLENVWLQRWSVLNYFRKNFLTPDGTEHFRLPNILTAFSNIYYPQYLLFGFILIFFIQKSLFKNRIWLISLGMILVYALFLAGIPYQNQRFFLLSTPLVAVVLYPPFERILELLIDKKSLKYSILGFLILSQLFLSVYFFRSAYERNILERDVANFVKSKPDETVYTFDIDVSFMSYGVNNKIINMWKEKINQFEKNSIVIFNDEKLKVQWANMNPMLNWKKLNSNYTLTELKNFGDGWKAYEIR